MMNTTRDVKFEQLLENYAPPNQGFGRGDVRANDRITMELDTKMDALIEQVGNARA